MLLENYKLCLTVDELTSEDKILQINDDKVTTIAEKISVCNDINPYPFRPVLIYLPATL